MVFFFRDLGKPYAFNNCKSYGIISFPSLLREKVRANSFPSALHATVAMPRRLRIRLFLANISPHCTKRRSKCRVFNPSPTKEPGGYRRYSACLSALHLLNVFRITSFQAVVAVLTLDRMAESW